MSKIIESLRRPEPIDPERYVTEGLDLGINEPFDPFSMQKIENLDGVPWADAPIPPRAHRCWPQTIGHLSLFEVVYRCACGAIKGSTMPGKPAWIERNSRKKTPNAT